MKQFWLATLFGAAVVCFAALGIWQLERRIWKLDLIARVEARVHADPVAPPQWQNFNGNDQEYRRVRLSGTFDHDRETLVDASTDRGIGYWILTPLSSSEGIVLVNRGFVPSERRHDYQRPSGLVAVVGLLRLSEPEGRILRPNDVQNGKWYSRDVKAIAKAKRLGEVAPYFIDAGATSGYPIGGLTVVKFRNSHLLYAITWFALAGLAAFGVWKLKDRA